jgi:hypothetical protein
MLLAYKHTKEEEHLQQQQVQPANHRYSGAISEQPLLDEYAGEALNDAARQVRAKGPIDDARSNDRGKYVEDAVSKQEEAEEEGKKEGTVKAEHPGSGAAGDKESQNQKITSRWWEKKKKPKKTKPTGTISKRGRK